MVHYIELAKEDIGIALSYGKIYIQLTLSRTYLFVHLVARRTRGQRSTQTGSNSDVALLRGWSIQQDIHIKPFPHGQAGNKWYGESHILVSFY